MKVLLAQSLVYVPTRGGANKGNRLMMEELARRGHECMVVAPIDPDSEFHAVERVDSPSQDGGGDKVTCVDVAIEGVSVRLMLDRRGLVAEIARQVSSFDPSVIIVSAEDVGQAMLRTALSMRRAPVVYMAHTSLALPCGPAAAFPSPSGARLLREARAIITISDYLSSYVSRWSGCEATLVRLPLYGQPPYPSVVSAIVGYVTMINACELKGISIFLSLADELSATAFAAVPGWGTTKRDVQRLRSRENVTVLPAFDEVDEVLGQTSVLLVPSLCPEVFGHVVVEAMLRGVPVVASAVGGLPEAKLGVDYCIPVSPIESYSGDVDERMLPEPIVPCQDSGPWVEACTRLLADTELYGRTSRMSREASLGYVRSLSWDPLEDVICGVC